MHSEYNVRCQMVDGKPEAIISRADFDEEGKVYSVFNMTTSGEWVYVAEGSKATEDCIFPVTVCD